MAEETTAPETPATETPAETAKYTDTQLNDLIAKNSSKAAQKAQSELFEKLGIKDASEIDAIKAARQAQMTEAEKTQAALKEKDTALEGAKKEADAIRAENEALKKGVPADKVERVKKLVMSGVYEGETIAEKVAAVLAEFPEYAKGAVKDIGAPTNNEQVSDVERLKVLARKQAGLA